MRRQARQLAPIAALCLGAALLAQPAPPTPGSPAAHPAREDWDFRGVKGEILRTTHYRVYTTETDTVLKRRLIDALELALTQYRTAIVDLPAPTQRLDVYLMDDRRQWENVTRLLMDKDAEMLLRIPSGGYASRGIGVFYDIGLYPTIAIASHEGWHQYTQRVFENGLPVWLEEGLASFMEGHRWDGPTPEFRPWANLERFDQLRKAHAAGRLLPVAELVSTDPKGLFAGQSTGALDYYAQVWALAHFLHSGADGRHAASLRQLLTDAAEGRLNGRLMARQDKRQAVESITKRLGPAVLLEYFDTDLDALGTEYSAFIDRVVAVGGRERVAAGISPLIAGD